MSLSFDSLSYNRHSVISTGQKKLFYTIKLFQYNRKKRVFPNRDALNEYQSLSITKSCFSTCNHSKKLNLASKKKSTNNLTLGKEPEHYHYSCHHVVQSAFISFTLSNNAEAKHPPPSPLEVLGYIYLKAPL